MLQEESASLRYHVYQVLDKMDKFWTQICPKMVFWVEISKI